MTTSQLAEELNISTDTVAKACKRHPHITNAGGGGRGAEVLWSRLAETEE
jgi:orotate phosphoribosyltransferase-like protein